MRLKFSTRVCGRCKLRIVSISISVSSTDKNKTQATFNRNYIKSLNYKHLPKLFNTSNLIQNIYLSFYPKTHHSNPL